MVLSDGKGESSGTGSSKGDAASGQSSAGGLGAAEAGASGADLVRAVAVRSGTASASVGEGLGRSRTERSSGKLGAGAVQTLDRFGSDPIVGVTR